MATRRMALALIGAGFVAACGGVDPYVDRGTSNLTLKLAETSSNMLTSRRVYVDVWTGPKGPGMDYLGTVEVTPGASTIGLPLNQPLHLALVFEKGGMLSGETRTNTIEIPMAPLGRGERWQITAAYTGGGFSHDLRRVR